MSGPVTLDPESVEAVACRVAELLRHEDVVGELVDAAEVARHFNVSREWVYEHADELGALRLGDGPKARLRFDPAKVADALSARPHPATDPHPPRSRPRRRPPSRTPLLPIASKASREHDY